MDENGHGNEHGQRHGQAHLLFVSTPGGYELVARSGNPPEPGSEVTDGEKRYRVTKVAASPLPGDPRRCAYLQPL